MYTRHCVCVLQILSHLVPQTIVRAVLPFTDDETKTKIVNVLLNLKAALRPESVRLKIPLFLLSLTLDPRGGRSKVCTISWVGSMNFLGMG